MQKHFELPLSVIQNSNVKTMGKIIATDKETISQTVKILHGQHHTISVAHRWNLAHSNQCPLCKKAQDTRFHVFECEHHMMRTIDQNIRHAFILLLRKMHTHPEIQKAFRIMFVYWNKPNILEE